MGAEINMMPALRANRSLCCWVCIETQANHTPTSSAKAQLNISTPRIICGVQRFRCRRRTTLATSCSCDCQSPCKLRMKSSFMVEKHLELLFSAVHAYADVGDTDAEGFSNLFIAHVLQDQCHHLPVRQCESP